MIRRIAVLWMAAAISLGGSAAWAEDAAKTPAPTEKKSESITGFGNMLGSDHFLSVGVLGGYGAYLFIAPGVAFGANVGVTFWNHLEVAFNFKMHPISFGIVAAGVSGTLTQLYWDVLYRTGTGSGFFIGPSLGFNLSNVVLTGLPASILPAGSLALPGTGFTFGGKMGYDFGITRFLSVGVLAEFFGLTIDGIATVKFWF